MDLRSLAGIPQLSIRVILFSKGKYISDNDKEARKQENPLTRTISDHKAINQCGIDICLDKLAKHDLYMV